MEKNKWLTDEKLIESFKSKDTYYLKNLAAAVNSFLKKSPVAVVTTYDQKHESIYFSIGSNKKYLRVDNEMAIKDVITVVDRMLKPFYPSYDIEVEKVENYTNSEIAEMIAAGEVDANAAFTATKTVSYSEKGLISRVYIPSDEFKLELFFKNMYQIRTTVGFMPLSDFMSEIRNGCKTEKQVYDFILKNSKVIKEVNLKEKERISIRYPSEKMIMNFFKVNKYDMYEYDLQPSYKEKNIYEWGHYDVLIDSLYLYNQCKTIIDDYKNYLYTKNKNE